MSIRVMTKVWEQSSQQGSALVILLAIADFASDEGLSYPSVAPLGKKARISERQVHSILRKLQEDGELSIERNAGPHRCNLYSMWPALGNRVLRFQGAVHSAERVRPTAPDPSIDPSGASSGPSEDLQSSSLPTEDIPASKKSKRKTEINNAFRERMQAKYMTSLEGVQDEIDKAIAHKGYTKYDGKQRYVEDWLKRAVSYKSSAPASLEVPNDSPFAKY